jgi:acetyltransferase-like isoleucine patch superfamily enzyme
MRKTNNKSGKDYRYWCMRSVIKRWPIWLSHKFPLPFLDNICLKLFGIRTKYSNSLFEAWVDTEFIEFGKEVVLGQGSIIQSSVIVGNLLIIRKTVIEDNVKIGAHSVVMPGTILCKNSILAASSMTTVGQELEEGWIYLGVPAKKFKENVFYEDYLEEIIEKQMNDVEKIRQEYEKLYTKRYDKDL